MTQQTATPAGCPACLYEPQPCDQARDLWDAATAEYERANQTHGWQRYDDLMAEYARHWGCA